MLTINQDEFNLNLLITKHYCERQQQNNQLSVAEVLRSFNPEYNGKKLCDFKSVRRLEFAKGSAEVVWNIDPYDEKNDFLYDELFDKQIAHKKEVTRFTDQAAEFKGRVLVAEVDNVIHDGFSEDESDGFIDYNDCPPVDTWFYMARNKHGRVLYAWIPEQYIKLVEEAISVNAFSIIIWLEDFIADGRDLN
ncbi:hypothetical protein AAFN85_21805 [Mucilaginibacter sp. CAU 1740]|uniref:hypothetical protein n=1 Tax=Mucilaginibacter sp. CAU 1740 TaxID=3140365 RepID=UPI00325A9203